MYKDILQRFAVKKSSRKFFTPGSVIALSFLVLLFFLVTFAPLWTAYGMSEQDLDASLAPPSREHILGADKMGRDLYTRLLYGGRVTIVSAFAVVIISAITGIPLGLLAGYKGGRFDAAVGRVCDVLLSFPSLLLAFIFVTAIGRGLQSAILALGIIYVPMLCRLVRSLTLVEKNKTYVEACRSIGFPPVYILFRHILPNCVSTIAVQLSLDIAYALLDLAALSFIGLGVSPPTADWGAMLDEGRGFLLQAPLLALAPGLVITLTIMSINVLCDCAIAHLDEEKRL